MPDPSVRDLPDEAALQSYVAAAAGILGLVIAPDWQDAVLIHLKAVTAAYGLVADYPLDDAIETAPIYRT